MHSDGTQLAQVTNDPSPTAGSVYWLALWGNGGKIVFQANTDPLGNNPSQPSVASVSPRSRNAVGRRLRSTTGQRCSR